MHAKNDKLAVCDFSDRVKINGTSYEAQQAAGVLEINTLIAFRTNSDGQINSIEFPEKIGTGETKYYNSYEKTFGKIGSEAFGTNESTSVICVPVDRNGNVIIPVTEEDYLAKIELDENDQYYTISGYDINTDTKQASLVVIKAELSATASTHINNNSKIAVAVKVTQILDGDMNIRKKITFWSEGKIMSYLLAPSAENKAEFTGLSNGSIFYYALNVSDEICEAEIMHNAVSQYDLFYQLGSADFEMTLYGSLENMVFKDISFDKNRYVDIATAVTASDRSGSIEFDINVRNAPVIYLYPMRSGEIEIIQTDQLRWSKDITKADRIFAHIRNREVVAIVAIR
jgi:hypothetical protein